MLDQEVLTVFRGARLTETGGLVLPEMRRDLYDKCKRALDKMGFRWDGRKSVRAHVMQGDLDPAQALAELMETGKIPNGNQYAFWPSSPALIDAVLDVASRLDAQFHHVLEPSAGTGAILRRVVGNPMPLDVAVAVEIHPKRAAALREIDKRIEVIEGDFLTLRPTPTFDTVLMNPPFALKDNASAYVDHIEHAIRFLAPGGVLSAVVPAGFKFRTESKIAKLRENIGQYKHIVEDFGSDPSGMKTGVYMLVVGIQQT